MRRSKGFGPEKGVSAPPEGRREVAAYIASMAEELRTLARRNDLPLVAYLLDIARLEAETTARDPGASEQSAGVA